MIEIKHMLAKSIKLQQYNIISSKVSFPLPARGKETAL